MATTEDFWRNMPESLKGAVQQLRDLGLTLYPSGSRLFCPAHVRNDSDWDVYALAQQSVVGALVSAGWRRGGSVARNDYDVSASLYINRPEGSVNAILFFSQREFEGFRVASHVCAFLGGPVEREARIRLFETIRSAVFATDAPLRNELAVVADSLEDSGNPLCDLVRGLCGALAYPHCEVLPELAEF